MDSLSQAFTCLSHAILLSEDDVLELPFLAVFTSGSLGMDKSSQTFTCSSHAHHMLDEVLAVLPEIRLE